jgi:hypothetical protein
VATEAGHNKVGVVETKLIDGGSAVSDCFLGITEVGFELWPSFFDG